MPPGMGHPYAPWALVWFLGREPGNGLSPKAIGVRPVNSTRTVVDAVRQSEGGPIGSVSDSQAGELFFN